MKSTLRLKFIMLYIIFGFLSIFTVSLLSNQLLLNKLEQDSSQNMYRIANQTATSYLPSYFSNDLSAWSVHSQLQAMQLYLNASVWFVKTDGTLITSAPLDGIEAPEQILEFDPAEIGNNQFISGNYHGYFEEDVITVMAPVTQDFSVQGYLLIHRPIESLKQTCHSLILPVYITMAVIYLLSFLFLIGFEFFVFRPLRQITEAATQYASGNLTYEIPVTTHDEMGYLSASLNYMSSQLKDMEEYQKKIVANVSHDFRSPLTSIKGYVQAMTDGTIPPQLHQKYLNIILFETERLTDLTQDLLTLNEFEVTEKNEKVFVSVKDTGMGIPKKELNKIWERFYKSDLSRGKDKKGTGLGLAIVKEAIQAHDEHINVISTEGVGTEFIFSLTKV